jgi:excisionase family DNA binding protein
MSAIERPPPPRIALTVEEACASLGVSWDTWREHIESDVRLVRIGRRKLVPVAELEHWCEKNAEALT